MQDFLPRLIASVSSEESMAINRIKTGALIIAGSGMCTGGRIRHHFKHNIWRRNAHVIIVGFQARGTPGRALVDGSKVFRIGGDEIAVGGDGVIGAAGGLLQQAHGQVAHAANVEIRERQRLADAAVGERRRIEARVEIVVIGVVGVEKGIRRIGM